MVGRISWTMALVSVLSLPILGRAQMKPTSPVAVLANDAQELENQKRWLEAAQVYAQLLANEPMNPTWREAVQRCLTQERIAQRYRDGAVRQIVETWKLHQAMAAYEEFLRLAEQVFVEPVSVEQLWKRGCEQVLWALDNPAYTAIAFAQSPTPEQLSKLREVLQAEMEKLPIYLEELTPQVRMLAQRAALYARLRPTALVWEFLAAGCEALDAYGAYVTPTGLLLEKLLAEGRWVGVGLEVVAGEQGVFVTAVAENSGAAQQGVLPGSQIQKIHGEALQQITTEEVLLRLLGPVGSTVEVEISTPDGETRRLQLRRQHVSLPSVVTAEMLDSMLGIAYVRIRTFQASTPQELDRALEKLSKAGLQVLLLDLRGNAGGSVRAALEVADRFIAEGSLLITQGRFPEANAEYAARSGNDWRVPVIVLVDEGTASAAEMVAAALQAHAHAGHITALIVGKPTRGKAYLQQFVPLAEGQAGAVYLSVARWLTPSRLSVALQGIQPDILVKPATADPPMADTPMGLDMGMDNPMPNFAWQAALAKALQLFAEQPQK